MLNCFFVGIGGFFGSVFRYLLGQIPIKSQMNLPIMTLLINIIGSFFIGFVVAAAVKNGNMNEHLLLFLKVGLCGGFTTFSTFSLESQKLFQTGQTASGLFYILFSVALCIVSVASAEVIVKTL